MLARARSPDPDFRDQLIAGALGVAMLVEAIVALAGESAGTWIVTLACVAVVTVVLAPPFAAGRALRHRTALLGELSARARRLEREREERARRAALEERNRIASELHDVVAHGVSSMVVQAGAARRLAPVDGDHARE